MAISRFRGSNSLNITIDPASWMKLWKLAGALAIMRNAFAGGMLERISRISGDRSLSAGSGILGSMVDLLTSVGYGTTRVKRTSVLPSVVSAAAVSLYEDP